MIKILKQGHTNPLGLKKSGGIIISKTLISWLVFTGLFAAGMHTTTASVDLLKDTIVDTNGLNFAEGDQTRFSTNVNGRTYQRPPLATFNGYQYVAYYDDNRHVCLGRRKLPNGDWNVIRFTDYVMPGSDSHNVVTLGICAADGTIHLSFDNHADLFNYRVSEQGVASNPETTEWSTELFGPVSNELGNLGSIARFTYPYFFNAPNGNLMLYYRDGGSGNGNGIIQEYDGTSHNWTPGLGRFIGSTGSYNGALSNNSATRNPYLNGISYGGDRIHVSWGWRESSGGSQFNHDLNYAYSDDDGRTWHNNEGTLIGTTGSNFITVDSPGLVVAEIPQDIGLSNQYTHYAYVDGSCHVMVAHNPEGSTSRRYHHYWRDSEGNWNGSALTFSGSRPKMVGDEDRNLFLVYSSGGSIKVAKGTPNTEKTEWTWSSVYAQSSATEAGEGQIDYTRWESDGVLSVFGQERPTSILDYGSGPPINGLPSPIHVYDYQVSEYSIQPNPAQATTGASLSPQLEWSPGISASTFHLYLGTDREAVANATPDSPEHMDQLRNPVYQTPTNLNALTDYYWRVDGVQRGGPTVPGDVWRFTTADDNPSINPISFNLHENQLEFTYLRSSSDVADGVIFTVEMTDSLQFESWTSDEVTQEILNDTGTIQTVKATLPAPSNGRRFVSLRITE